MKIICYYEAALKEAVFVPQPIDCVVLFHNGVEIRVQLVITPLPGSKAVGRITKVRADDSDTEVAERLLNRNVNFEDRIVYLPPYTATYQESANRGPSP